MDLFRWLNNFFSVWIYSLLVRQLITLDRVKGLQVYLRLVFLGLLNLFSGFLGSFLVCLTILYIINDIRIVTGFWGRFLVEWNVLSRLFDEFRDVIEFFRAFFTFDWFDLKYFWFSSFWIQFKLIIMIRCMHWVLIFFHDKVYGRIQLFRILIFFFRAGLRLTSLLIEFQC